MTTCPLCRSSSQFRFERDGYAIQDCTSCDHRFAGGIPVEGHAERHYGDDYFSQGGAGYADYLAKESLIVQHGRRYGRLLKRFAKPVTLLDVGAAAGFILNGLTQEGWRGEGLEPNERMARYGQEQFGLTIHSGSLETTSLTTEFDAISMVQVAAHFVDPLTAFATAARLTRPGGLWLIETWDRSSRTARLFGKHWHEYSPPTVLHWYTGPTLRKFLSRFGMRMLAQGKPMKWLDGAHAKSLLGEKLGPSPIGKLARACLKVVPDRLPIPYPSEDLFWAVFRKEGGVR